MSSRSVASFTSSRADTSAARVHAHVERRVDRVREAALRAVELHRRDAEVEQDRVGADVVVGELAEDDRGLAAQEPGLHPGSPLEAVEVRADGGVAVDRDELAAPTEVRGEQRGVAARAEGGVDDGLARAARRGARAPRRRGRGRGQSSLAARRSATCSALPSTSFSCLRQAPRSQISSRSPTPATTTSRSRPACCEEGARKGHAALLVRLCPRWRQRSSSGASAGSPC